MNKSHSDFLLGMLDAIMKDGIRRIPGLSKEIMRDHQRLVSCVKTRGSRVLTIDLPALGKEYDLSLSEERLILTSNFLTGRKRKDSPVPKLFWGLVMRIFDTDGLLRHDPDIEAVRFLRQVCYFAKKWRVPCAEKFTYQEVREFFQVDSTVKKPTLNWREPILDLALLDRVHFCDLESESSHMQPDLFPNGERPVHLDDLNRTHVHSALDYLQRVADVISSTLGNFEPMDWRTKHGPGVVSDHDSRKSKYDFPKWPERLEHVFPMSQFGFANEWQWTEYVTEQGGDSHRRFQSGDVPSRLIAVPKTQKGPRLIAAEPTANQWCQQSIKDFLATRVACSWISRAILFQDQTRNQQLALIASKTSAWSTIDLSAASDRMSCYVVERMFRRNTTLLDALHCTRTFIIRNPVDKKCSEFSFLNKFSTMGSACTFPVQSLVFLAVAIAASFACSRKRHYSGVTAKSCEKHARRIAVFGDDIIVPTDVADTTMQLLEYLGFKVNMSKTHSGANRFRESCGMDAFAGNDVTPAYALTLPKRAAPDSYVSQVATAHNFYKRGNYEVAAYIRRTTLAVVPSLEIPWVECGSGIFGWPSPMGFDVGRCKTRHNPTYQRMEYRSRRVITRIGRQADRGPSRLLQYFVEAPSPMINWMSGVAVKGLTLTRSVWEPLPG